MKVARIVAFVVTVLCLAAAVLSLVLPTKSTFDTGSKSYSWSCGSAAFPKTHEEFDRMDDILNCVGDTPASAALDAVVLAGLGLVALAFTTWRIERVDEISEREQARS